MNDFIKKLISSLLQVDMKWSKHTTAPEYLFQADNKDAIKLSKEMRSLPQDSITNIVGRQARKTRPTTGDSILIYKDQSIRPIWLVQEATSLASALMGCTLYM